MRGCIFGAGDYHGELLSYTENAYIVAADGGLAHLTAYGLTVDLAIGDFDSLGRVPSAPTVKVYPEKKDDTDMSLAADAAIERGCRELFLFGGMGGRFDHTFANIALLHRLAKAGVRAYLVGESGVLTVMTGGEAAVFASACKGYLSVFSLTDRSEGVTLSGLAYELEAGSLDSHIPLGVSNAFVGKEAKVTLAKGALLLYWECLDDPMPKWE